VKEIGSDHIREDWQCGISLVVEGFDNVMKNVSSNGIGLGFLEKDINYT
jgi:hypothetical protein